MNYLSSLDIVDPKNIGLSGHLMGGWASVVAAQVYPDAYKSIVLEGSSTGTFGGKTGDATFPRNLGLIYSKFDGSLLGSLNPLLYNRLRFEQGFLETNMMLYR